jgi:hypothetical protein
VVGVLLAVAAGAIGCASGGCSKGEGYKAVGCRSAAARDLFAYGDSRDGTLAAIGESEVEPPWANALGIGPAVIHTPFDSQAYTSSIGDEYEVVRYFVEAYGSPDCPFVQGRLILEPLIFLGDELVGWNWPYMDDVLKRRMKKEEVGWSFGTFCE